MSVLVPHDESNSPIVAPLSPSLDNHGDSATSSDSSDFSDSSVGRASTCEVERMCSDGYEETNAATRTLSLQNDLREWALNTQVPASHFTSLLKILKAYHPELPADARTLLKTQRDVELRNVGGGLYYYFGMTSQLTTHISDYLTEGCGTLSLIVNIDGLPISKSSRRQFWPILVMVKESRLRFPFIVALYEGEHKPQDLGSYLKDFVEEMSMLMEQGLTHNGKVFCVRLHALVCDAPARAYIKCIKGHMGYFGCEKCNQKGTYSEVNQKVIFPDCNSPLRTDESFRKQVQKEHHHGESPLLCLNVGLVTQFPLDYMHLVCLGVMKKFLVQYWVNGKPCSSRMPVAAKLRVSAKFATFRESAPSDMKRRPRGLQYLEHWKAVEHRNFLLYYGPVALKGNLEDRFFKHFLKLSAAVTILICPNFTTRHMDIAECILQDFVSEAGSLYGNGIYVYNMHSLLHLADDARNFGPLDEFSAFPFENFLYQIKKLIKSHSRALQQVVKRLSESGLTGSVVSPSRNCPIELSGPHNNGPVPPDFHGEQYSTLAMEGTVLKLNKLDNCVKLKNGHIVLIRNFLCSASGIFICGNFFSTLNNLYVCPLPSSELMIFSAQGLSEEFSVWCVDNVQHKCVCLPNGPESYAIFPLLHTCSDAC
uniref:Putative tick transposon n=1 Tax=Rhipicephalus pulchellus TaxID=72859 RepID=L7LXZ4_RHIPC